MKISVIIVNFKVAKEILDCLNSFPERSLKFIREFIVIDNSNDKKLKDTLLKSPKNISYHATKDNIGFGAACNLGASIATSEIIFFLNPDTKIVRGSFDAILSIFEDKKIGLVAPLLLDKDGNPFSLQGTRLLTPKRAIFSISFISKMFPNNPISKDYWMKGWNKKKVKEVDVAPGTALFMRKEIFENIGGFDEKFFLFFEEFDLCKRLKSEKFKIIITPVLQVLHLWGNSTRKNPNIDRIFKESRFYYFKKNYNIVYAILTESILRITFFGLILSAITCIGLFLRFYKLSETMIFIGDQGWFYLSALNLIKYNIIPLVGIPSSVVWLHQGPLATYLIALSLFIGNMNAVFPAYIFGILDTFTIVTIYIITKKVFHNRTTGLLAALFYATSPVVLISARTPYHTTAIPFFVSLLLLLLLSILTSRKKLIPLLFFIFGLVIQLELSNAVLIIPIVFLFWFHKIRFTLKSIIFCVLSFLIGILPFLLYDIGHNFVQTLGLPLWIINRIRLFLGITIKGNATTMEATNAIHTINHQLEAMFSTDYKLVYFVIILLGIYFFIKLFKQKKYKTILFLSSLTFIPLLGFMVHAAPGVAYFPLVFPIISVAAGGIIYVANKDFKIVIPLFLLCIIFNSYRLLSNNYFIITKGSIKFLPVNNYSYGYSVSLINDAAVFLERDPNKKITIVGKEFYSLFPSNFDNLKYLLLVHNKEIGKGGSAYYIYPDKKNIVKKNIVFSNEVYTITK